MFYLFIIHCYIPEIRVFRFARLIVRQRFVALTADVVEMADPKAARYKKRIGRTKTEDLVTRIPELGEVFEGRWSTRLGQLYGSFDNVWSISRAFRGA